MLTEQELINRRSYLGSSDIPVLLGFSPWRTAYDLWLEKTGKLEKPQEENESMALGSAMEGHLLDWAAKVQGDIEIIRNQFRVHAGGIVSCTHDALAKSSLIGFEAKTAGIVRGWAAKEEWGESGTDKIPEGYIIQCQTQALVSNLDVVWVPALLGGRGRVMYCVKPNKDIMDIILERATAFWEKNVKADIPPEGTPTFDVARYIKRTQGKRISIAMNAVQSWRELDAIAKEAQDKADEAKAKVLALMGDADEGESELGIVKVSKVASDRIDSKTLKTKFPDIAKQVSKETLTTRITFKETK